MDSALATSLLAQHSRLAMGQLMGAYNRESELP